VKTWRGRPATNSSGSDNLLARVWALVSCKYSLFGVQHSSGHPRPDRSRLCRLEFQKPRTILATASGMSCGTARGSTLSCAVVACPRRVPRSCDSGDCCDSRGTWIEWQNFGNLRRINRRRHVAVDDLHLPPCGLVCDRRYFSLNNFAAVKADSDAGAYAVVHVLSILGVFLSSSM
jgi:hypothetical protein